ncbi:MAG: hypothetical protein ABH879_09335 [archaeon]
MIPSTVIKLIVVFLLVAALMGGLFPLYHKIVKPIMGWASCSAESDLIEEIKNEIYFYKNYGTAAERYIAFRDCYPDAEFNKDYYGQIYEPLREYCTASGFKACPAGWQCMTRAAGYPTCCDECSCTEVRYRCSGNALEKAVVHLTDSISDAGDGLLELKTYYAPHLIFNTPLYYRTVYRDGKEVVTAWSPDQKNWMPLDEFIVNGGEWNGEEVDGTNKEILRNILRAGGDASVLEKAAEENDQPLKGRHATPPSYAWEKETDCDACIGVEPIAHCAGVNTKAQSC